MALKSYTLPLQAGEEASLTTNTRVRRFMNARLRNSAKYVLSNAEFHREIIKPLQLKFARAITNTPNSFVDIHGRSTR